MKCNYLNHARDIIAISPRIVAGYAIYAILPILGIVASIIGAIAAGMATSSWDDSWTAGAKAASEPVQASFR